MVGIEADSIFLTGFFFSQGIFQIPTVPEWEEEKLRFEVDALGGRYEGGLNRDRSAIRGDWHQAGGVFRLTLSPIDEPPRPARPQEPEPPFPYHIDTVSISHSDGEVVLAGTLTTPTEGGPHPAAVLVSGSGPQDRDRRSSATSPSWFSQTPRRRMIMK